MELQSGMKIAAHERFLGMIYSYTGRKCVERAWPFKVLLQ